MNNKYLPVILIYLIGMTVTAWYVFGTRYLELPDAVREYFLYRMMRLEGYWSVYNYAHQIDPRYILQTSCLFTTLIPAKLSLIMVAPPELFYRIYITVLLPFLPVGVYALARKFTGRMGAFIAALFIIFWVSFIDGASTARTGIALAFYSLALYLIFSDGLNKYLRYFILIIAGVCIPLSHYTSALLTVLITGGVTLLAFIFKWPHKKPLAAFLLTLTVASACWYLTISGSAGSAPAFDQSAITNWSLDLPARAALGLGNPHDSSFMGFTYTLMLVSWGTIVFLAYGIYKALRIKYCPPELRALGVISFVACVLFFAVPPLQRVYGVERVYFQGLVVLGIFFVHGVYSLIKRWNIPGYAIALPLVIVYGAMMKAYELIHSIVEYH